MPQMAPMWWLLMMIMFSILMLNMMSMIYFNNQEMKKMYIKTNKKIMIWKW